MAPEKRFLSNYYYFNSIPEGSLPWSFYTVLFFLRRYRKWFSQKAKTLRNISSASPLTTLLFSRVQLFATPWTAARQAPLSFTISWSLLKLMSIELVMPSNHLILCHPLLLPSVFPSIRVFSSELALCIRWPKYWNFSFSLSPSNEYTFHWPQRIPDLCHCVPAPQLMFICWSLVVSGPFIRVQLISLLGKLDVGARAPCTLFPRSLLRYLHKQTLDD